eukprot:scaffold25055_cov106-Isochrysis_galbana.AAC.4
MRRRLRVAGRRGRPCEYAPGRGDDLCKASPRPIAHVCGAFPGAAGLGGVHQGLLPVKLGLNRRRRHHGHEAAPAVARLAQPARPAKRRHVAALGAGTTVERHTGCARAAPPLLGTSGRAGRIRERWGWPNRGDAHVQARLRRHRSEAQHDAPAASLDGEADGHNVEAGVALRQHRCAAGSLARGRRGGKQAEAQHCLAIRGGESLHRHDAELLEPAEPGHQPQHVGVHREGDPAHPVEQQAGDRLARDARNSHQAARVDWLLGVRGGGAGGLRGAGDSLQRRRTRAGLSDGGAAEAPGQAKGGMRAAQARGLPKRARDEARVPRAGWRAERGELDSTMARRTRGVGELSPCRMARH